MLQLPLILHLDKLICFIHRDMFQKKKVSYFEIMKFYFASIIIQNFIWMDICSCYFIIELRELLAFCNVNLSVEHFALESESI